MNFNKYKFKIVPMKDHYDSISKGLSDNLKKFIPQNMGGWGNGYVMIDKTSPIFSEQGEEDVNGEYRNYENILDAPGGITLNEDHGNYHVVGFDTAHSGMDMDNFPMEVVLKETLMLYNQVYPHNTDNVESEIDSCIQEWLDEDPEAASIYYFRIHILDRAWIFVEIPNPVKMFYLKNNKSFTDMLVKIERRLPYKFTKEHIKTKSIDMMAYYVEVNSHNPKIKAFENFKQF